MSRTFRDARAGSDSWSPRPGRGRLVGRRTKKHAHHTVRRAVRREIRAELIEVTA